MEQIQIEKNGEVLTVTMADWRRFGLELEGWTIQE